MLKMLLMAVMGMILMGIVCGLVSTHCYIKYSYIRCIAFLPNAYICDFVPWRFLKG